MKKEEKKMIGILILVAVVIIGIIYFATRGGKQENNPVEENKPVEEFVEVLEDGTKLNTSTKLNEMKMFEGLKFGNIQLTQRNGKTELIADVVNESGKDSEAILFDIVLYDKEGNKIITLGGRVSPIKAGETKQFSTSATLDYANAYDFKLIKK